MGTAWRPKNSPPTYNGPTRLRIGLAQSKNVMAVRVLQNVGLDETIDFLTRFGFKKKDLPRAEPLALGAGSLTPLEVAQGLCGLCQRWLLRRSRTSLNVLKIHTATWCTRPTRAVVCNTNASSNKGLQAVKAATAPANPATEMTLPSAKKIAGDDCLTGNSTALTMPSR